MPRRPPPSPQSQPGVVDPEIWRLCAGTTVEIPTLHSRVYYFPQGHFEQASSVPRTRSLSPRLLSKPAIPCRVVSLQFLADPVTDEVFAKMILHPIADGFAAGPSSVVAPAPTQNDENKDVVPFSKVLTVSDANNGEGFSVPKDCADFIFPLLNFKNDPPVQNLLVTDVHGFVWEFRHIYRGSPRRHLLTTGWSTFVNNKKLIAGDSVVFMKNSRRELFVGIRRPTRFSPGKDVGGGMRIKVDEEEEEEEEVREAFSRDGRGKLSAKVVAEAAELAACNMPFEAVYYPKAGWSEFVVKTETVHEAISVKWRPGMKVKIATETDDSSGVSWCQGTVSSVSSQGNGQWRCSTWRMLQVTWDEPQIAKWVSPWQVELVSITPALQSVFTPAKRVRTAHDSWVFTNGVGDSFPMTGFTNSTMRLLNQALLSYGTFPAGVQGASTFPWRKPFEKGLNVGIPQSDGLLPDSRGSLQSCGIDVVGNSRRLASGSFQLFGAVIQTEQPVENGLQGTGRTLHLPGT